MKKLLFFVLLILGVSCYLLSYDQSAGTWDWRWVSTAQRLISVARTGDLAAFSAERGRPLEQVNGKLAAGILEKQITWIPLERIPQHLRLAIVAVEDHRFYQHGALDFRGLARAALVDIRNGAFNEGGSTITQQLAKNLFLDQDKTLGRKAEEAVLAYSLEKTYSKDSILEMYLNQIYFGSGIYGVGKASVIYFGKTVDKLTLAEAAMLAGIPRNPAGYSPVKHFAAAKERQGIVLDQMTEAGFISRRESELAKASRISLKSKQ